MNKKLYIIKLGGSAITDKNKENHFKEKIMDRIAQEISSIEDKKIIIHGAGSFAHPIVKRYDLHHGFRRKEQLLIFSRVKENLSILNRLIMHSLIEQRVACTPFTPSAFILADKARIVRAELDPMRRLLKLGFTPVLHGDIVEDASLGFSIISGDQLTNYLAKRFKPNLVVFGCDVDGIFDDDPIENRNAQLIDTMNFDDFQRYSQSMQKKHKPDVTGGMYGKIKEAMDIAQTGIESVIINITKPGSLVKLINKKPVRCTRILNR